MQKIYLVFTLVACICMSASFAEGQSGKDLKPVGASGKIGITHIPPAVGPTGADEAGCGKPEATTESCVNDFNVLNGLREAMGNLASDHTFNTTINVAKRCSLIKNVFDIHLNIEAFSEGSTRQCVAEHMLLVKRFCDNSKKECSKDKFDRACSNRLHRAFNVAWNVVHGQVGYLRSSPGCVAKLGAFNQHEMGMVRRPYVAPVYDDSSRTYRKELPPIEKYNGHKDGSENGKRVNPAR